MSERRALYLTWESLKGDPDGRERVKAYARALEPEGVLVVSKHAEGTFAPDLPQRLARALDEAGLDYLAANGAYCGTSAQFVEAVTVQGLGHVLEQKEVLLPWGQLNAFGMHRERSLYLPQAGDVRQMIAGPFSRSNATQPSSVTIDITSLCNLRCAKCVYHQARGQERQELRLGDMDMGLFSALVDELSAWERAPSITLSMRGEPLVHRRLFEATKLLSEKGLGFGISSNGLLLTPPVLDTLLDHGLLFATVSLDAARPETYKRLFGLDGLAQVEANLENMLQAAYAGRLQVPLVNFVLGQGNDAELEEFLERWQERVYCIKVVHYEDLFTDRASGRNFFPLPRKLPCATAWATMYVMSDGSLRRCCQDGPPEAPLGRFPQTSLLDAWRGEAYAAWRESLLESNASSRRHCRSCAGWSKFFTYHLNHGHRLEHVSPLVLSQFLSPEAWAEAARTYGNTL